MRSPVRRNGLLDLAAVLTLTALMASLARPTPLPPAATPSPTVEARWVTPPLQPTRCSVQGITLGMSREQVDAAMLPLCRDHAPHTLWWDTERLVVYRTGPSTHWATFAWFDANARCCRVLGGAATIDGKAIDRHGLLEVCKSLRSFPTAGWYRDGATSWHGMAVSGLQGYRFDEVSLTILTDQLGSEPAKIVRFVLENADHLRPQGLIISRPPP